MNTQAHIPIHVEKRTQRGVHVRDAQNLMCAGIEQNRHCVYFTSRLRQSKRALHRGVMPMQQGSIRIVQ